MQVQAIIPGADPESGRIATIILSELYSQSPEFILSAPKAKNTVLAKGASTNIPALVQVIHISLNDF